MAIRVREPVSWFSRRMEAKLKKRDHRGKRGWEGESIAWLLSRAFQEMWEANCSAIKYSLDTVVEGPEGYDDFIDECADAANMLMMAADEARRREKESYRRVPRSCIVCHGTYRGKYPACGKKRCQEVLVAARRLPGIKSPKT